MQRVVAEGFLTGWVGRVTPRQGDPAGVARPAAGSTLVGWSGCAPLADAGQCAVSSLGAGDELNVGVTFDRVRAPPPSWGPP